MARLSLSVCWYCHGAAVSDCVCVCAWFPPGTEAETRQFMAICVETVAKYGRSDVRTPVFIFERLCSIIEPELNELGPFLLSLEKDPQQEDFLQVRNGGHCPAIACLKLPQLTLCTDILSVALTKVARDDCIVRKV